MEPRDFCYWLQGLFELSGPKQLTQKQVRQIKQHLDLVMTKVSDKPKQSPPKTGDIPMPRKFNLDAPPLRCSDRRYC